MAPYVDAPDEDTELPAAPDDEDDAVEPLFTVASNTGRVRLAIVRRRSGSTFATVSITGRPLLGRGALAVLGRAVTRAIHEVEAAAAAREGRAKAKATKGGE